MLVICFLNNIVLRGREFCTSSIAQITGNVPRLLADIVGNIAEDASLVAPTKRGILSGLVTLYNPLGLISPLSVPPRVFYRNCSSVS